jgi:sec-independent protein translocase protein TatC
MTGKSRDLFNDSTMSFGEHLEILRVHLLKAIIGLAICVLVSLYFGNHVIDIVRGPIDVALADFGVAEDKIVDVEKVDWWQQIKDTFTGGPAGKTPEEDKPDTPTDVLRVTISADELAEQLYQSDPQRWPKPASTNTDTETNTEVVDGNDPAIGTEKSIVLDLRAPEFRVFRNTVEKSNKPVTLNVQEAFLTYLKVSFVAGFVIASPWVFYQTWLFVAAGLYPHERKYVYIYLPMSLGLFLGGAAFCFKLVFPFVLKFLLGFNALMKVQPQIRLSEWISFAIMLPLMFGLSFQLPLVMLFLERISVFDVETYRTKRRMAILVIAVVSMMMTPADPASMLLMMFPLVLLYELGIIMCRMRHKSENPFGEDED